MVPRDRQGRFLTELFERYPRSEKAFVPVLLEMYAQWVSTRKVKKITEELCGVGKTTLMATLLGFLPPGERIVTGSRRGVIEQGLHGEVEPPATFLAHEIGSGA